MDNVERLTIKTAVTKVFYLGKKLEMDKSFRQVIWSRDTIRCIFSQYPSVKKPAEHNVVYVQLTEAAMEG